MSSTSDLSPRTGRRQEWILAAAVFALTALVFWPAVTWLASQTFAREQLKQAFFIVVLAGLWIGWEQRSRLRLGLQFSGVALAWLAIAYALAGAAIFLKSSLLFLAGLVAAVGGSVNFVFGAQAFRRTVPMLTVFGLLIVCVLLFPVLDWPLRQMAGVDSARFLQLLGLAPQLEVIRDPEVMLLLKTGAHTFVVATECNGFGLITSSLLLGLIRLLYLRTSWIRYLVLLPLCIAVAFVFNFLRISGIVLLAPRFPGNYMLLHETAGIVALYSGLGFVWLLTGMKYPRPRRN